VREVPPDRHLPGAAGWCRPDDGLHLDGRRLLRAGGVDDEVDAGVGGHPGGVDAEFQQLVLDEEFPPAPMCNGFRVSAMTGS
jgi:hypothetical protein